MLESAFFNIINAYKSTLILFISTFQGTTLEQSVVFDFADGQYKVQQEIGNATWECSYQISPTTSEGVFNITARFKVLKGTAENVNLNVGLQSDNWSAENYVLLPACAYNGNRFQIRLMQYPPCYYDKKDHQVDMPINTTFIPHLSKGSGPSKIEQNTGDLATPAIGYQSATDGKGFFLFTDQQTRFGNTGVSVVESEDRKSASFYISAPCVRESKTKPEGPIPSGDKAAVFKEGDEITLRCQMHFFEAADIPAFYDYFFELRKIWTGPSGQQPSEKRRTSHTRLPFGAAWNIQEDKYNRQNWEDSRGYYSVGMRETINQDWQLGWVGGCMATLPLLFAGEDISQKRAYQNLETILSKTQAPSGFFYGLGNGTEWWSDGFSEPFEHNMHLLRKNADALYYFIKQFELIKKQNPDWQCPQHWHDAVRKLAQAFVDMWQKNGQFGQFIDIESGEILVGGSTSAAIVPAGLVLAAEYFNQPEFMVVAKAAARAFYERDVKAGVTTGGPSEILQAPDSESAFALLESYVILYEANGEKEWLNMAEDAAKQFASWCVSYDYAFPEQSPFGQLDMKTTGAVFANAQNKHGAPGICTFSGDALFKLYRATGNRAYLDLIRDIAHNITQYVSRKDRPIQNMDPGWVNERVNLSDWEGPDMVGDVFIGTTWAEVSAMLTWIEIPGLYVHPQKSLVYPIDHLNVKILQETDSALTIELTNPTEFDTHYRIFVETEESMANPLDMHSLLDRPLAAVKQGKTQTYKIFTDGRIEPFDK